MNYKKLLFLGLLSVTIFACKSRIIENTNSNAVSGGGENANSVVNTNINSNINTNANAKPAADNSPKRISFGKGANWGAVNITLAAGASQKFVVGAKSGQIMEVEVSSKETSVNLIKGKAETTEDFGFLNAELQATGDYVFEVKNSTKKEIKTSVKVTIEGGKQSGKDVEEPVSIDDNGESPESNSKGNGK